MGTIDNSIGKNIKRYRKERKLTQSALAKLIGKSESTIRKYEAGNVEPSWTVLDSLAKALNVDFVDLATKLYSSEFEMYDDARKRNEIDIFVTVDETLSSIKSAIHYLVQLSSFEKEFGIKYKDLSNEQKINLKSEVYRGIQYACFKIESERSK